MTGDMSISVCLASYNGERFIARQLASILEQLAPDDEVILVDDCSTDRTVEVVRGLDDPRIALYINDRNRGEVYSFGRAISRARNAFIFLSDQDDLWIPDRALLMQHCLVESGASVVSSNFHWMDSDEHPIDVRYDGVRSRDSTRHFKNVLDIFLGKTNYFGCAMAFRRTFASVVVPIPSFVESHDLWIALASNLAGSNVHLDAETLRKRKHDNNATSTVSHRRLSRKLRSRWIFALSVVVLLGRYLRTSRDRPSGEVSGA